jgi:hypothetical protein
MPARSFFDANILIYADDKATPAKQRKALDLVAEHWRARTGVVSLQVLQEYFVAVTRKLRVDAAIARRKVELLAEFDVAVPEVADILAAPLLVLGRPDPPRGQAGWMRRALLRGSATCARDRRGSHRESFSIAAEREISTPVARGSNKIFTALDVTSDLDR